METRSDLEDLAGIDQLCAGLLEQKWELKEPFMLLEIYLISTNPEDGVFCWLMHIMLSTQSTALQHYGICVLCDLVVAVSYSIHIVGG